MLHFSGTMPRVKSAKMLEGVDKIIGTINAEFPSAQSEASQAVGIKNYESIASYSWKDIDHPTIYVPGLARPCRRIVQMHELTKPQANLQSSRLQLSHYSFEKIISHAPNPDLLLQQSILSFRRYSTNTLTSTCLPYIW
jgi:hypothetical protein